MRYTTEYLVSSAAGEGTLGGACAAAAVVGLFNEVNIVFIVFFAVLSVLSFVLLRDTFKRTKNNETNVV